MVFSDKGRFFRHLLIGLAVLFTVIILALLATPLIVPSDFIASQITSIVRQKTGRDLRISGPISFTVVPKFALVAHDVTLANPSGFSGDFLSVKTVDVALKALALLHGSIEIEQLKLVQPRADFEVDKAGQRNWVFYPPKPPLGAPPGGGSARPIPHDRQCHDRRWRSELSRSTRRAKAKCSRSQHDAVAAQPGRAPQSRW